MEQRADSSERMHAAGRRSADAQSRGHRGYTEHEVTAGAVAALARDALEQELHARREADPAGGDDSGDRAPGTASSRPRPRIFAERPPRLGLAPPRPHLTADAVGVAAMERVLGAGRSWRIAAFPSGWHLLTGGRWRWLQFATDVLMLLAAAATAAAVAGGWAAGAAEASYSAAALLYPALVLVLMWLRGAYGPHSRRSIVDVLAVVLVTTTLAMMALVTAAFFIGVAADAQHALRLWLFSSVAVGLGRTSLLLVQRHAHRSGRIGLRTLVVGAGEIGSKLVRNLRAHPEYGIVPIGMLDAQPTAADGDRDVPVVGSPEELVAVALQMRAEHVIFAFSSVPDHVLLAQIGRCEQAGMKVSLVPRLFESLNERVEVSNLGTLPIMSLHRVDPNGWQFGVKYVLDRVVAAVALVVLLPVMLLVAAAVKLTSPGPVFFRQRRVGRDGHAFDLLKFRSMYVAGDDPAPFVPRSGLAPGGIEGVDRRTPLGRLLRRTFLDELPQLLNVLRGDMSLVGPRPERPEYVELFEAQVRRYGDRHRAKAGITGWAQVHGLRGQTELAERIEYDNQYIDNWSLGMDLRILLLTAATIFSNRTD